MSNHLTSIDGLLIDINGVLTIGDEVIPGALETLDVLRARGIPHRFIPNTTIYCRYTLLDRLQGLGLALNIDEVFTATFAAAEYLRSQNAKSYYPLLLPDAQLEFTGIEVDEENPEFVVVGDMGSSFNYTRLNQACRALLSGAKLIALQKKRLWRTENGLFLDAGPFVVALEYASGQSAHVVGKPSYSYFHMVLNDLNLPPERVAVIGDDIEIDVRGAQHMGMQGWLVKTGRFRKEDLGRAIWPEQILDSFSDIINK
ncbi:TIGR01458 family HAD-type hydrolase [Chloroflexi bacterium TSY]|nr:TIGR01458 family HAD-type hydrolase [Chloroflexi bacterium TSY]